MADLLHEICQQLKDLTYKAIMPTHNEKRAITASEIVAIFIFLLKNNYTKEQLLEYIEKEYNKYNKLNEYELKTFGTFYKLVNAMHILEAEYIIKTKGDSEENQYWLNEGKVGFLFSDNMNSFK